MALTTAARPLSRLTAPHPGQPRRQSAHQFRRERVERPSAQERRQSAGAADETSHEGTPAQNPGHEDDETKFARFANYFRFAISAETSQSAASCGATAAGSWHGRVPACATRLKYLLRYIMSFPGALSSFSPSPRGVRMAEVMAYPKPLSHRGEQPVQQMRPAIKNCVLFEGLSTYETMFVLKTARPITTHVDMLLYEQDDAPSCCYLVHSGTYRAEMLTADGTRKARDYGPLDNFGACELLSTMGGRSCTIRVLTAGKVWAIPMRTVQVKLRVPPPMAAAGLLDFCRHVKLFQDISRERLLQLCRGGVQLEVPPGKPVFQEGEEAKAIYVLREGTLHTSQSDSSFSMSMTPPESFGERDRANA